MPDSAARQQQIDATRRRGYVALCLGASFVQIVLAVTEWPRGNWLPIPGALISLALLVAVLNPRVSLQRIDQLLGLAADVGAVLTIWSISLKHGPYSAQTALILTLFFVLWFGVLPLRAAAIRAALLYLAIVIIGLVRQPLDFLPLLYFGFVALLIGQMTYSGRHIRQELSETAKFADLAMTDPLTELQNRRSMYSFLQDAYTRQSRGSALQMAILLADIDHFKNVNDNYGHEVGDQVLQHVAGILKSCVRPGDHVARWGGEEFLVMVQTGDRDAMELIGKRILYSMRTVHSGLPPVTLSIGVALASEAGDVNTLLRLADRRLYRAKRGGRNQLNMEPLNAQTTHLDGSSLRQGRTSQ